MRVAVEAMMNGKNYLTLAGGVQTIADPTTAGKTAEWTPAGWTREAIAGKNYHSLVVEKPLDDEQGTGVADAERAMLQYDGGKHTPDATTKSVNVGKIGWSVEKLKQYDGTTGEGRHSYVLDHAVTKGDMITVTLVWDKLVKEKEGDGTDGDGKVEKNDTYKNINPGADEESIPNFVLAVQYDDGTGFHTVARTAYKLDPVQHLHFPAPADGATGKYRIVVTMEVVATAGAAHDYSLAWWTK